MISAIWLASSHGLARVHWIRLLLSHDRLTHRFADRFVRQPRTRKEERTVAAGAHRRRARVAWIRAAAATLLPSHGCRSETGSDRALVGARSSRDATVSSACGRAATSRPREASRASVQTTESRRRAGAQVETTAPRPSSCQASSETLAELSRASAACPPRPARASAGPSPTNAESLIRAGLTRACGSRGAFVFGR